MPVSSDEDALASSSRESSLLLDFFFFLGVQEIRDIRRVKNRDKVDEIPLPGQPATPHSLLDPPDVDALELEGRLLHRLVLRHGRECGVTSPGHPRLGIAGFPFAS